MMIWMQATALRVALVLSVIRGPPHQPYEVHVLADADHRDDPTWVGDE